MPRKPKKAPKPSKLNRWFHHIDQGSRTGREIGAGILACVLSVCGMFMNMQLVTKYLVSGPAETADVLSLAANGEIIAQMWFFSMLFAFAGSLLMGVLARLPLVHCASLGLSTTLISTLSIGAGLTYQNLLAVSLTSSGVYTLIAAVPKVRKAVVNAIPQGVRRAIPAAMGVLMLIVLSQLTGLVTVGDGSLTIFGMGTEAKNVPGVNEMVQTSALTDFGTYLAQNYKADSFYPQLFIAAMAALTALVAFLMLKKTKHPLSWSLLIGTAVYFIAVLAKVVFYVKRGKLNFELDSLWGRLWMVGSEDAMHLHLGYIFNNFSFGEVLKKGFDFAAYEGSVILLFATGILTHLLTTLCVDTAMLDTVDAEDGKGRGRAHLISGAVNVLAPLFGAGPMTISPASVAMKREGGRSGIAAITAAIGFAISSVVWVVPFIFATSTSYDIVFNMYGHYGKVLQWLTETSFTVADAVMMLVACVMIAHSLRDGLDDAIIVPFLVTIVLAALMSSLPFGVAAGVVAHGLGNIAGKQRSMTLGEGLAIIPAIALMVTTILL